MRSCSLPANTLVLHDCVQQHNIYLALPSHHILKQNISEILYDKEKGEEG